MPANGRWDLIRRLKVKTEVGDYTVTCPLELQRVTEERGQVRKARAE